jgi:hypothetical protein
VLRYSLHVPSLLSHRIAIAQQTRNPQVLFKLLFDLPQWMLLYDRFALRHELAHVKNHDLYKRKGLLSLMMFFVIPGSRFSSVWWTVPFLFGLRAFERYNEFEVFQFRSI